MLNFSSLCVMLKKKRAKVDGRGARRQVPQDINPQKDDSLSQRKAVALQKLDWVRNSRV